MPQYNIDPYVKVILQGIHTHIGACVCVCLQKMTQFTLTVLTDTIQTGLHCEIFTLTM